MEAQKPQKQAKVILSKNRNTEGNTIPVFKLHYRAIEIKTAWYKNRHENQWNRIEDPDINPHSYSHLLFYKGAQNI
jgi:uncharacterized protein (DUF736 family)